MPRKIDISQMTTEEIVTYAERVNYKTGTESTSTITILLKLILRSIKFGFKSVTKQKSDNIKKNTNNMNN